MKKILAFLLLVSFMSCKTKTKNTTESKETKTFKQEISYQDSISKLEKRLESEFSKRLAEVEERSGKKYTETSGSTENEIDVTHNGGTTIVDGPNGQLKIEGSGTVNVKSSSKSINYSKAEIEELNRKVTELTEIRLENENLILELKVQQGEIITLEEKLKAEKAEKIKITPCRWWMWFFIGLGIGLFLSIFLKKYFKPILWIKQITK